jgi:hypothetical protein
MNILNREQFLKHMSPEHNYLHEGSRVEIEEVEETEVTLVIEEKAPIGRGEGNTNIPDFMRKTIASLANEPGVKGKEIAHSFAVSNSVVSQAKHGRISHDNTDAELKSIVKTKQEKIQDAALEATLHALNLCSVEDIGLLGAKDKMDVAMKASKVYDNLKSKTEVNDNRVQFVIMSPPVREHVHYETIDV